MFPITARLNKKDLSKIHGATTYIKNRSRVSFHGGTVCREGALQYTKLLTQNILSNKFAATYAPYHPQYAKYKASVATRGGFWQLYGDLLRSIQFYRHSKTIWKAGVKGVGKRESWFTGKGSRKKPTPYNIAKYATIGEFGSSAGGQFHPARPIFRPTLAEFVPTWYDINLKALKFVAEVWKN